MVFPNPFVIGFSMWWKKIIRGLHWRSEVVKSKWHVGYFAFRLQAKWRLDRLRLPLLSEHYPLYRIIHQHYHKELGCFPNLVNCRDYNDKIQWLKLFDQDEAKVRCSDKLLVREHVRERVGERYLVPIYQVADHYARLDFSKLPNSFVIKTNHDSGTVMLVRDKGKLDHNQATLRIDASLQRIYGWQYGEWGYAGIGPKVFAEQFIDPENASAPPDYKFHCVDGRVKLLQFIYDRGMDPKEQMIDRDGQEAGFVFDHRFKQGNQFEKPACWSEMVAVAEAIAKGFKYVRVDLYYSSGRIYAGEMTFWPMAGCYHGDGQKRIGAYLDFDRRTVKPPIAQRYTPFALPEGSRRGAVDANRSQPEKL
jgi:hypothetical protein